MNDNFKEFLKYMAFVMALPFMAVVGVAVFIALVVIAFAPFAFVCWFIGRALQ